MLWPNSCECFVFLLHFQASDFSNVGDWPILGKVPVTDTIRKPMTNAKDTPTNASAEIDSSPPPPPQPPAVATTTTTTTTPPITTATKPVEKESSPAPRSNRSSSRSKSATSTSNDQAQSPVNGAASGSTTLTNGIGNGTATNGKRNSKQRWVPLDIDISKSRSKRDSTPRNKRRDVEYEDDYSTERPARSSRRYRIPSYRGGRSSAIGRGARRNVISKNSTTRSRNDADYSDYPSEYTLVNKIGTAADVPPFMMPYLGTYYYNGVPGFTNMDSLNIKDAIKKQM